MLNIGGAPNAFLLMYCNFHNSNAAHIVCQWYMGTVLTDRCCLVQREIPAWSIKLYFGWGNSVLVMQVQLWFSFHCTIQKLLFMVVCDWCVTLWMLMIACSVLGFLDCGTSLVSCKLMHLCIYLNFDWLYHRQTPAFLVKLMEYLWDGGVFVLSGFMLASFKC